MDVENLIQSIHAALDENKIAKAVASCLRLARITHDTWSAVQFLKELSSGPDADLDPIRKELQEFDDKERKQLWEEARERWMKRRMIDSTHKELQGKVFARSIGDLEADIQLFEQAAADAQSPPGLHPVDLYFNEKSNEVLRTENRAHVRSLVGIRERVRMLCLDFVTDTEKLFLNARRRVEFAQDIQQSVDNYLKKNDNSTFQKLQKAQELLVASDPESLALSLTELRRALKGSGGSCVSTDR